MPKLYPTTLDLSAIRGTQIYDPPTGILGTENADTLNGTAQSETIYGYGGNDTLFGNAGADTLYGGLGSDKLYGGDGDDVLYGGAGADVLSGGSGFDTVSYASASAGIMLALSGGATNDAGGDTFSSIEKFVGTQFADVLVGAASADFFAGNAGDDWLDGGAGDDKLAGGAGIDFLRGGSGNDQFILGSNEGVDTISDFQHGQDKIVLTGSQFSGVNLDFIAATDRAPSEILETGFYSHANATKFMMFNMQDHNLYLVTTTNYWDDESSDWYHAVDAAVAVAKIGSQSTLVSAGWLAESDIMFG